MNKINFKNAVKRLSTYFKDKNIEIPHNQVLNSMAIALGYKDYPEYVAHTNDPAKSKPMKSKTLVIYHNKADIGKDIVKVFMGALNQYFKRANTSLVSKRPAPDHFPEPDYIEYQANKTIITWEPKDGYFPENTGIVILVPMLYSRIKMKYPSLCQHIVDMNYVEKKIEIESMKMLFSNH